MSNRFITFEGGEGSGKSTQARLLAERLTANGHEVVLTREPGGSPLAEKIRAILLQAKPVSPEAEFLLFAAARAEHIAATIKPALERGAFVVCDRYLHSTRVYQGALGNVDRGLITAVERATVAPYYPALTFLMDLPPETGLERAVRRGDINHYDAKDLNWHTHLRAAFLHEAEEEQHMMVVDASRAQTPIAEDIWSKIVAAFALGAP